MDLKTNNNTKKEDGVKRSFQAFDWKPGRIPQLSKINGVSSAMTGSFGKSKIMRQNHNGDHWSCQIQGNARSKKKQKECEEMSDNLATLSYESR